MTAPSSDGAVAADATLPVRVTVGGHPTSVSLSVGGRRAKLARHGSSWSTTLRAATWLKPGRNTLRVDAVASSGIAVSGHRVVYRAGRRADLGLHAVAVSDHGRLALQLRTVTKVAALGVVLNTHELTSRFRVGRVNQTVYLGGDEGLRPGANTVHVLATDAAGGFQAATVAVHVAADAPVAAATTQPGPAGTLTSGAAAQAAPRVRVGQAVTLDGSGSRATKGGTRLSYSWSITGAPAGSHAKITDPGRVRASFSPDVAGRYLLTLTVTDRHGRSATDTTPVLSTPTVPPVGEVLETQAPGGIDFGGTVYPATGGQPLELLLIDRSTLVATAYSGGQTVSSIQALTSAVTSTDAQDGLVEVLTSPAGYDCGSSTGATCTAFETLLQALTVDSAKTPANNDATIHGGLPFSTITITSSTDTSVWRSSAVPSIKAPLLPGVQVGAGNLGGHLEWPDGNTLAYSAPVLFVPDTSLGFTTSYSSTPTTNVMRIGSCLKTLNLPPTPGLPRCQTFASTTLSSCGTGSTGGFQVVVLWAASLAPIANQTFTTNSGCGPEGITGDRAQLAAMLAFVTSYVNSGGTKDYLVMIQSIGSPRPQTMSVAVNSAWTRFGTQVVVPLGGTGSVFDFLGYQSGYTLLGYSDVSLPGFGAPFGVETSGDTPHVANAPLPAALSGNLARNQRNDYYPQTSGPVAGAAADGLASIVTRPPSAWPQEDTPGKLNALAFLTTQMIAKNYIDWGPTATGNCWGLDHYSIRDIYCDLSRAGTLKVPSTFPTDQPSGKTFSQADWTAVTGEISAEQGLISTVQSTITTLQAAFNTASLSEQSIGAAVTQIEQALNRPTTTPVRSPWSFWLSMFSSITDVVGGFVGIGDGLDKIGAFLNAMAEGLNVGSQLVSASGGSSQSLLAQKVQGTQTDIADDLPGIVLAAVNGLTTLEPIIFTDFGKLVSAANLVQTAPTTEQYGYAINRAIKAWATPLLVSTAYQPDALVSSGQSVFNTHHYAEGPYAGDANNFSCYYGDFDHGLQNFAPFPNTVAGGEYLAGSPTQRYVLATGEDPSDTSTIPRTMISPDQPPGSVLSPLFAPVTGPDDTTDLGLSEADVYAHTFGLGTGKTITCPVSPSEPTGAITATSPSTGNLNVFYATVPVDSKPASIYNDYVDSAAQVWHGPGALPGTPDVPDVSRDGQQAAPFAAVSSSAGQMHLFFLQKGKLVNDYDIGSGWQGAAELPGNPNNVESGGTLAAASSGGGDIHLFFWQGRNLVYDQLTPAGWSGPTVAVANGVQAPDVSTQLAAVSTGNGSVSVYYLSSGGATANVEQVTSQGSGWSAPSTVVTGADPSTPLAATTDGNGHASVLYTSGSNGSTTTLMSSIDGGSGWTATPVASSVGSPLPSVAAASPIPYGMQAFVLPSNGHMNNQLNSYGWDPSGGWSRAATLPVPYIVGDFPA